MSVFQTSNLKSDKSILAMASELTHDSFLNGKLKIRQSKSGYRFSIDAILLADHAFLKPGDRVVDIGTGCGIISLILAYRHPDIQIFGIEIQKELADIAMMNIMENHMQHLIRIFNFDAKKITPTLTSGCVDMVICNPPHRETGSGRINANNQLAVARHEIAMTVSDLIQAAERVLCRGGRFLAIYPVRRMIDVLNCMHTLNVEPKKLCMIHSKSDVNAIRCLIEGAKGGKPGVTVLPPLIIYNKNGTYTDRVKKMFSEC
jgi:tRNA1Val (adenine37-N6)-methyltransferase